MPHSSALASPPIPFSHYPKKENCRKEKQQINRGQRGQTNMNHGDVAFGPAAGARATSLPQSMVAIPQVFEAPPAVEAGAVAELKRTRASC